MVDAQKSQTLSIAGARIETAGDWSRWSVRARGEARATWNECTGIALPEDPLRAYTSGDESALWLGPDEWLVLVAQNEADFRSRVVSMSRDSQWLGSVVDISARNVGIALEGPHVWWILQGGCPIDLRGGAFPVGSCTRTLFGKAEIVLWHRDETAWHLECWRSFAPYVWVLLEQTARECDARSTRAQH
jgi:sarcosine oxidase subunit gamma